jgi:hypothetical protein
VKNLRFALIIFVITCGLITLGPPSSARADTISACKLPPLAFTNVGLGLPTPDHRLPSIGDVQTAVLFADFSDVPASQTPREAFAIISPNAENFFRDISYGKMNWTLIPHFTWLRLSQPSEFYSAAIRTSQGAPGIHSGSSDIGRCRR